MFYMGHGSLLRPAADWQFGAGAHWRQDFSIIDVTLKGHNSADGRAARNRSDASTHPGGVPAEAQEERLEPCLVAIALSS